MFVFCCYGDIPQVSYSFVLTEMCKGTLLHWLNESLDQRQRTQSTRHKQDENFLAVSGSFVWMDLGMSLLLGHLMDCSPQDDHAQTHCPFRWSQAVLYRHCCAWKKESPSDFSWTWLTLLFIYLFIWGGGLIFAKWTSVCVETTFSLVVRVNLWEWQSVGTSFRRIRKQIWVHTCFHTVWMPLLARKTGSTFMVCLLMGVSQLAWVLFSGEHQTNDLHSTIARAL